MEISNIALELGPSCRVYTPHDGDVFDRLISRWSSMNISLPHAIATPAIAEDITKVIKYAAKHNLKVVPVAGAHGSFLPISSRTIYLSMSEFKDVHLDEERGEVTVSGGCVAGDVLKSLSAQGWYTCFPNSNAVGMIGSLIGGLNHPLVGLHGLGVDCIKSIDIVPFSMDDGSELREISLSESSTESSRARLFNTLCGAGHGLGVITSMKLKAWKIRDLNLTDGQIWSRTIMFPLDAVALAAQTYLSLQPPPPQLSMALFFVRAPPTAPQPRIPILLLSLIYFGPSKDAEEICRHTLNEEVMKRSINIVEVPKEFATFNSASEALNKHGDVKEFYSAILEEVDEAGIKQAYEKWRCFTDDNLASRANSIAFVTSISQKGLSSAGDFHFGRGRSHFVQALAWYKDPDEKSEADEFGIRVIEAMRAKDRAEGRSSWGYVNNARAGQDMRDIYNDEQIREIRRVKEIWDRSNVGWSPVVDGWEY
ncbi:uncharacterized protein PV09_00654 [Verruconis gallopava]|uniref:FAD-binding PCMH-type domain-containing protein n=1 Tax=Verruconis gallopava TaxID=253628 RepID=A0A0D2APT3_9PEZI|nr:uncharacterized protein PV09_00654 [Verruconis gallopava]KIW08708.1 hypothetical protein PV09_00654 [Verruconis gallopava]